MKIRDPSRSTPSAMMYTSLASKNFSIAPGSIALVGARVQEEGQCSERLYRLHEVFPNSEPEVKYRSSDCRKVSWSLHRRTYVVLAHRIFRTSSSMADNVVRAWLSDEQANAVMMAMTLFGGSVGTAPFPAAAPIITRWHHV